MIENRFENYKYNYCQLELFDRWVSYPCWVSHRIKMTLWLGSEQKNLYFMQCYRKEKKKKKEHKEN